VGIGTHSKTEPAENGRKGLDFFPLSVEYRERDYAAGKINGSRYIKREGRPSDEAVCNARLIDRAIRPRFPENFFKEIQVMNTVLSWDGENDPDVVGLLSSSLALSISDIPWEGPIAAVRVGRINNEFVLNPTYKEREESEIDLIFAGCEDGKDVLINMIEGGLKEVEESIVLGALDFAKKYLKELINFQKEIVAEVGKEKMPVEPFSADIELEKEIREFLGDDLEKAIFQDKKTNTGEDKRLRNKLVSFLGEKYPEEKEKVNYAKDFFEKEVNRLIHKNIVENSKRPDNRKLDEVREIYCETGLLPRTHGSGLFCRGKTKALSILTLGGPEDQQLFQEMEIVGKKRFMHHYNFPPYSTGEVKGIRGPGRREIGHGLLAEKALLPLIPDFKKFPYTIRIVSEIVSSNGSSSMASVCGSSLSLMDAGVPIERAVAGIAMGLFEDPKTGNYKIATDIQGPEDHNGDMDLKVAGTEKGITVLQMDVKIKGITEQIMEEALVAAKKARIQILDSIKKVLPEPRASLSPYAPKISTIEINPEKIGMVVGPGGRTINKIIERTGAVINIQDSGTVFVTSEDEEAVKKAIIEIENITREAKVGEKFKGTVKKILDFGAFVEIFPGQDGLLHISKLGPGRVEKVEDVLKLGDTVSVEVISIDEHDRVSLKLLN
jgi:polyribonucleotide nucleotidyltransferase